MTKISGVIPPVKSLAQEEQLSANTPAKAGAVPTGATGANREKSFADFALSPKIVAALHEKGITTPFPIQELTLPVALKGSDIIGQAKTGTGKTLGFGLPMLQQFISHDHTRAANGNAHPPTKQAEQGTPTGLIILPTRELAKQVATDLREAAKYLSLQIVELYGGVAYEPQQAQLRRGCDIAVGTPGRLLDLRKQRVLNLSQVKTLVLDEADQLLDLGFLEDVEQLIAATPATRHTMLFSATMPGTVISMARRYMTHPTHIRAQDPHDSSATVQNVKQVVYRCHELNKAEVIARILQARQRGRTIIFTKTKRQAAQLTDELITRGFAAGELHGNLGQAARERALRAFRKGKIDVLVATDVAARGIDIEQLTHVINYQCPEDEKIYLHRIGRTGRAGSNGTAITFADWEDTPRWAMINKALSLNFPQPVETYHTSAHLYTDLDIPQDVTGRLPREKQLRAGLSAEKLENLPETGRKLTRKRRKFTRKPQQKDLANSPSATKSELRPKRKRKRVKKTS